MEKRLSRKKIIDFQDMIFTWWATNRRDLPWRHTHNPYHILVSETMLQQTQVNRVIQKYTEFLDIYPTLYDMAGSTASDIIRIWKGLGYNKRALYLFKSAQTIRDTYRGVIPNREQDLLTLPGVGKYTARAILVFAYKHDVAMVDTNIRRIITHHFFAGEKQDDRIIQRVADELVPAGRSWEWHQALMDYGALQLQHEVPKQKKRTKSSAVPFARTNRFLRGRIIDALRVAPASEDEITETMMMQYERTSSEISHALEGLIRDGMIHRPGDGMIKLVAE